MKLIDAIVNVDRSPKTEKTVNLESLCHELGIFNSIDHEFDFDQRVKMYPIAEWAGDWDWLAGIYGVFFDDAPVGMYKILFEDEDDFSFISVEIAQKLRNYILDNLTIKFNIIRDENIGVLFQNPLVDKNKTLKNRGDFKEIVGDYIVLEIDENRDKSSTSTVFER